MVKKDSKQKLKELPKLCGSEDLDNEFRVFPADLDPGRMSAIMEVGLVFVEGTVLKYYLSGGTSAQKRLFRQACDIWMENGSLEFAETDNRKEAEIRVGFERGKGHWSYIGRAALEQPEYTNTMNLDTSATLDTMLHEIGHTLGLHHEHQNPNSGIEWDKEAVYAALAGKPNYWSKSKTDRNILKKVAVDRVQGSKWDPDSIMHYPFGAGLINSPEGYENGIYPKPGLSEGDKEWVRHYYGRSKERVLRVDKPIELKLSGGEQINFRFTPKASGEYMFNTFGADADTLITVFENGDPPKFIEGDDNSGDDMHALVILTLKKDVEYLIRLRLYWQDADKTVSFVVYPEPAVQNYKDDLDKWRWRIKDNNDTIAVSADGYDNLNDCIRSLKKVKELIDQHDDDSMNASFSKKE